jgi:hypothetical protein
MAVVSGTYLKYDAKGLREELSNVIYDISPMDTPFMSGAGRGKASQTLFEWQTDSLAAASTTNAQLEGDDASFTTPSASVRVGNYTQISRKTLIVSGTLEAVDKAGRKSEIAYQIAKRGKELKRDIEAMALENIAGGAGAAGSARTTAGLGAWVKSNVSTGASGGNPTYTSGVPGAARTDGTQRALTTTILNAAIQSCFVSGANVDVFMVGPFVKGVFSGLSGIATQTFNFGPGASESKIVGSADVYVSNFGVIRVITNRFQRPRDGWLLDFDMVELDYLRPFQVNDLNRSGDAEKKLMLAEWGLKVKNEAGLGLCADLSTS